MQDREEVLGVFLEYARDYDDRDTSIERKILHTLRVARIAQVIALDLKMSREDVGLAWFIGILHDIGRFEQERRYGTFVDSESVDHAALGADILFCDGLIDRFPPDGLPEGWRSICEMAVRLHNKLEIPEGPDERTRLFCRLIRDADKADIFRVVATTSFEERVGTSRKRFTEAPEAGAEVMECVRRHCCVPRKYVRSEFDSMVANCCMAFELDFEVTRHIVKSQGFLSVLLRGSGVNGRLKWNEREMEQLQTVKTELEKVWGMPL